jgi:hypothetical protein
VYKCTRIISIREQTYIYIYIYIHQWSQFETRHETAAFGIFGFFSLFSHEHVHWHFSTCGICVATTDNEQYVLLLLLRIANLFCNHKVFLFSLSLSLSIKQANQPDKHHTYVHIRFKMTYKKNERERRKKRPSLHIFTF